MLLSLRIENFALIDHLELEFGPGLNVLTGETGAGKSIILDALDAVLGGKITARAIRAGTNRCLVEAAFQVDRDIAAWLGEQEIDILEENVVIASREMSITQGGLRSRSRLNGILVNRQLMDQLRDKLVEITAQGQTTGLGKPNLQRDLLDLYGGLVILQQRQIVTSAYTACNIARQALEHRLQSEQQRLQRLDLLTYQLQELKAANLGEAEELENLELERTRLSHIVDLQKQSYQVYQILYQNDSEGEAAADLLSKAQTTLSDMVKYDGQLQNILDMISEALAQAIEAGHQLASYGASLEADPDRLQEIEERIRELKQICRKYGPTLKEAIEYSHNIQIELHQLQENGQSLEILEQNHQATITKLTEVCQQLTQLRLHAAHTLEADLIQQLKPLAMEKVQFQVNITPCQPTALGADQIVFMFSPNAGESLQAMSETASGGEMSRFLLALKACFAQIDSAGTLVFDEIDVGVSGRVAQAIAQKFHQLSHRHQVLCVTHQPIIAAMADRHFRVNKQIIEATAEINHHSDNISLPITPDVRTVVRVTKLDNRERREELAQLASGQSAQEAIAFAESLLTQADRLRNHPHSLPLAQFHPKLS